MNYIAPIREPRVLKKKYELICKNCGSTYHSAMPWSIYCEEKKCRGTAKVRTYEQRHPERKKESARKTYNTNEEHKRRKDIRNRTHEKYNNEKKGVCILCSVEGKTEFHHEDYNKPDDIIEICRKCHLELHGLRCEI